MRLLWSAVGSSPNAAEIRSDGRACDLVVGHANQPFVDYSMGWRGAGKASWLTQFRRPADRIESVYRWWNGHSDEHVAEVHASNRSLQEDFEAFLGGEGGKRNGKDICDPDAPEAAKCQAMASLQGSPKRRGPKRHR